MRVSWDDGNPESSSGISNGVLYPENSPGVSWNGLISVTENSDDQPSSVYMDGQKIRDDISSSSFSGTIEAFTYPDEFESCLGLVTGLSSQIRSSFGFSYRDNRELHIVYNTSVSPSSDQYISVAEVISPVNFTWNFSTLPVDVPDSKPSAHLIISLDQAVAGAISDLEDMLYGNDSDDPFIPDPATILDLFESYTTVRVTDNGDGTFTVSGPDSAVFQVDSTTWEINWPSAVLISSDTFILYSL